MNETLLRIREVFNKSGESQTSIGKKINKTSQYVWKLLNDDSANPSASVIADICREFSVNEEWLRTGEGEMMKSLTKNQEMQEFVNEVMADVDESFRKKLILSLSKLKVEQWEVLEQIAKDLLE